MTLAGCASTVSVSELPDGCIEKDDWNNYIRVALDKEQVFATDPDGYATRFLPLALRIDYLEAYCSGMNAYIGDESGG